MHTCSMCMYLLGTQTQSHHLLDLRARNGGSLVPLLLQNQALSLQQNSVTLSFYLRTISFGYFCSSLEYISKTVSIFLYQ